MEFRLTYEGKLLSSGNDNPNGEHKHAIRKKLHPQIKRLWETTPYLKSMTYPPDGSFAFGELPESSMIEHLAKNRRIGDYRFVPLVTKELSLWCGIDVLFLRPGPSGEAYKAGDIDNRIKTILDALKVPSADDLKNRAGPTQYEDPFYCLLDDDGFIAKLTIETDMLLEHIGGAPPSDHDARLVITVRLRPATITAANLGFA